MPGKSSKSFYALHKNTSFAPILIVPTVSTANVPQLATDLLIHSLALPLLGHLDSALLYPFAGPREETTSTQSTKAGFCTALEVFGNEMVTVLHQRSPLLPHCTKAFLDQVIVPFVQQAGTFKQICILASADATYRDDAQLQTPLLAFVGEEDVTSRLRRLDLSGRKTVAPEEGDKDDKDERPKLYGAGKFYRYMDAVRPHCPRTLGLCCFAYQGDNRIDAQGLCEAALKQLGVHTTCAWKQPPSWETVFGPPLQIGEQGGLIW